MWRIPVTILVAFILQVCSLPTIGDAGVTRESSNSNFNCANIAATKIMLQTIDNTCFSVKLTARGKSTLDKLAELVDNSRYIEPGCFENGLELIKRDVVSPEMMEELSKGATPQARFEERCIIYHEHLKPIGDREPGGPLTDSVSELAK